jgi:hypothetical protein
MLTFRKLRIQPFNGLVSANFRVASMLAGEEHAARRRTHGRSAVMLRESHPLRSEPIDIRRRDFLLPVTAKLAPTQVVGQDEYDVKLRRFGSTCRLGNSSKRRDYKWDNHS